MLDSRLLRDSQMMAAPNASRTGWHHAWGRQERVMELLWQLPVPWAPDALELVYVLATIFLSLGLMVAFGAWWSR